MTILLLDTRLDRHYLGETVIEVVAARAKLNDLEGKHLHQLKLTLEQTEALAAAWTEIKAMKTED